MRRAFFALSLAAAASAAPAALGATDGTEDLYGVRWHATLDHAVAAARPADGAERPILQFRVLGDLDGLT
jgi:hypothetical protein